jgi:phosphoribosylglycinamide formyltransferase 1
MTKSRIAILASGSGTNAENLIRYFQNNERIVCALIISNNARAFVLERAKNLAVPAHFVSKDEFKSASTVMPLLEEHQISHIVLAGFLQLIPDYLINAYLNKIINIHPALLPKHGGKGMYGMKVHEAVKISGDRETGISIHLVNEHFDEGPIVFQAKCTVSSTDTPEQIAAKVHELEYEHYPEVIERWILDVEG